MTAQELLDLFRVVVVDTRKPYLWKDEEVLAYMDDAYKMFVRLTGGVADFTSDITRVDIVAGENVATVSRKILRIMEAQRLSDLGKIEVINQTDMTFKRDNDYGLIRPIYLDNTPGQVRYMVIGAEAGKCRWVQMPEVDDVAQLYVYRLPLEGISPTSPDMNFAFDDVDEEHHQHLLLWMQHRAYAKPDTDVLDQGRSMLMKKQFEEYCAFSLAEWERRKHKTRVVAYGGL